MILCDVNVLVYAHREDAPDHEQYRSWLETLVEGLEPFGCSELVLSSFVRVVTNPRIFVHPTPLDQSLAFCDALRGQPNAVPVAPGGRHWELFRQVSLAVGARGNLVSDAYFAALALESGSTWATADRDYSRFPGLRLVHPLETGATS